VTWLWQISLFTGLYVVTGIFGFLFAHNQDGVTLIWPPTGLSLAALILFGRRLWPGIFIGALLLSLGGTSSSGIPATAIAIGNTLEALVGATLLRVAGFRPNLERMQDGMAFLLIGVLGCTTISATIGVTANLIFGYTEATEFGLVWLNWWLGDAGGALILTPVLLMVMHGTPSWGSLVRRLESWLVLALLLATSLFAFFSSGLERLVFPASVASFPILVWAGTRLGPRGAVMASFLTILIATIATGAGFGPAALGTRNEATLLLWAYAMFVGISALTLAAVVGQRNAADLRYRSEEAARLRIEKQKLLLEERERLTREMHDGLGGQLVSVLSMVERGLADRSEVAESIRRAIDEIRIVIDSLDPHMTDLPTSLGKLRSRLEPLLRRNGIVLSWSLEDIPGLEAFRSEAVLHVLRIVQEAVTNTLRHADADRVEVKITGSSDEPRQLHISVRDDGRGLPWQTPSGGRGIKNMKFRAEELGAVLQIKGAGSGLQIDLAIPFPR